MIEFGKREPGIEYIERAGAYAIIPNQSRLTAEAAAKNMTHQYHAWAVQEALRQLQGPF